VESSHLRVVPRTEDISRRWMVLDALNPPNMYIEVAIELTNVAKARTALYWRRYLTRGFRIGEKENTDDGVYRTESTCHGGRISYWEDQ